MAFERKLQQAAEWIARADGILICAGAGMGVDSGLPDFRGNNGFWRAYPALKGARVRFQDIANPVAFARRPSLAWGFYGHRLALYRETIPHEGYAILKELASTKPHGGFVFTSNVDGLFQKAGFDEQRIIECHGSIHFLQCVNGCRGDYWSAAELAVRVSPQQGGWLGAFPLCSGCGGLARPNILMFDDAFWIDTRTEMQNARLRQWRSEVTSPVVIELGAGTHIRTVRCEGERLDCPLIRINPREFTVIGHHAVGIGMGALEGLRAIRALLTGGA